MSNQANNNSFKMNIGGPSIILLLTVLGLAVFSILAVRAAYSGLKMARTSASAVSGYYEAEGIAQEAEYLIKEAIEGTPAESEQFLPFRQGAEPAVSAKDVIIPLLPRTVDLVSVEADRVVYEVPVNDTSVIHVEMTSDSGLSGLKVTDHRLVVDSQEGYSGSAFEINEIDIN